MPAAVATKPAAGTPAPGKAASTTNNSKAAAAAAQGAAPKVRTNQSLADLAATFRRKTLIPDDGAGAPTQKKAAAAKPAARRAAPARRTAPAAAAQDDDTTAADDGTQDDTTAQDDDTTAADDGTQDDTTAQDDDGTQDDDTTTTTAPLTADERLERMEQLVERLFAGRAAADDAGDRNGDRRQQQPPAAAVDFTAHPEVKELSGKIKHFNNVLAWCEENTDGGTWKNGKQEEEYDAAQVRQIKLNAQAQRLELVTDRSTLVRDLKQQHASADTEYRAMAFKAYPDLKKKDSELFKTVAGFAENFPAIRGLAGFELFVADAVRGRDVRKAAEAKAAATVKNGNGTGNGKGAPKPGVKPGQRREPPQVLGAARTTAPRVQSGSKEVRQAEENFRKTGRVDDLASMFSRKRAARAQDAGE